MSKHNQKGRVNINLNGEINGSFGAGRAVAAVKGNQSAERFAARVTHQATPGQSDVSSFIGHGETVSINTNQAVHQSSRQQENMGLYRDAGKVWDADKGAGNPSARGRRAGNARVKTAANAIRQA